MTSQLKTVLHEDYGGETVIIYQLFDNSCFLYCDEEGNRGLPVKGRDHLYHIPGRLVMASRDEFRDIFTVILPLLRAGLDNTKVLLSPLMRYIVNKCCEDDKHITNKSSSHYGKSMGESLGEMEVWLRDLAFTRRVRNFVVMCPNTILGDEASIKEGSRRVTAFWKEGPVHLTREGYTTIATGIVDKLAVSTLARKVEDNKQVRSYSEKSKMVDRAASRPSWVKDNDSSIHRRYDNEDGRKQDVPRGRGRGLRRGGGGRGRPGHHRIYRGRGFNKYKPY
jgi:hypothetical protein